MRYYSDYSVSKIKLHQRSLNNLIVSVSVWDCCTTRNVWLKWTHDFTPTVAIKIKCQYKLQLLSLNSAASASTPDNICNSMSLCLLCLCFYTRSFTLSNLFCLHTPAFLSVSHLCPGYRPVPAHRGSRRSHGTILDCGWTGHPCRKN